MICLKNDLLFTDMILADLEAFNDHKFFSSPKLKALNSVKKL